MRWFCVPSKKLTSVPLTSSDPVAPVEPVVAVKKCPCKCAPVACAPCAPVACVPVKCVPRRCSKPSQPLVLRSTPPAENEKLTSVVGVSAPDATLVKAPATEAVSQVSQ